MNYLNNNNNNNSSLSYIEITAKMWVNEKLETGFDNVDDDNDCDNNDDDDDDDDDNDCDNNDDGDDDDDDFKKPPRQIIECIHLSSCLIPGEIFQFRCNRRHST